MNDRVEKKLSRFSRLPSLPPKQGELADEGRGIKPVTSVTAKREEGKKKGERE